MTAYIYQAALLCEECALKHNSSHPVCCPDCKEPIWDFAKGSKLNKCWGCGLAFDVDSDDYPQGPHSDGGGKADSPQHCDHCHVFLENPLTSDGYEYVRQACFDLGVSKDSAFSRYPLHSRLVRADIISEWSAFYECFVPSPDDAHFDRFDICLAHYMFACEYYSDYSQQCRVLQKLERMRFKPGRTDSSRRMLENPSEFENALNILARLVRGKAGAQ